MCGICGIIYNDPRHPVDREILQRMNRTMVHRGPDDEGYHLEAGAGLAMRRLSIIDVSGGRQPVTDEASQIVAVCNGEIYNFQDLRAELATLGHSFRSKSDAEILPHLYEEHGVASIARLAGMFGLAIWDSRRRRLLLARDRMGKKPLYWARLKEGIIFGSELKALLAFPGIERRIDPAALAKYLAYEYVPCPRTIFTEIHKLEPGHRLVFEGGEVAITQYWDVPTGDELINISEADAVKGFRDRFEKAVEKRLISDVPLGVFLSGGIDSSSVVAAMTRFRDPQSIKTFSIAFEEKSYDEASYARQVAAHFGTDHREEHCRPQELLDLLPEVTNILDEPMADPSIVPTLALSKFTRRSVTVALGGDGGDELFAGYPTFLADRYALRYQKLPRLLRGSLELLARSLPISDENISFDFKVTQFLKGAAEKSFARHAIWLGAFAPAGVERLLLSPPHEALFDDIDRYARAASTASLGNRLLYVYKKMYLQEDILVKVDRASMGASLECRAPFLDHEVVEFVARLPYHYKRRGKVLKYLLKKAYGCELPRGIAERPKKGFGVPVSKWIRGPLLELARDYLAPERIAREGWFNPQEVARLLDDHLQGKANNRKQLWTLLIFERWLERWG